MPQYATVCHGIIWYAVYANYNYNYNYNNNYTYNNKYNNIYISTIFKDLASRQVF